MTNEIVRDRQLLDLIDALENAIDLVAFLSVTGKKFSEREGENLCAVLDEAVTCLGDLRD